MAKLDLYLMYFCALVAMSVLYAPQPIAVLFESELGIARQSAGLFIAALTSKITQRHSKCALCELLLHGRGFG